MMDIDSLITLASPVFQAQVTQFGIAFAAAAWIHSGRVKKEIKASFAGLSLAISELGETLKEDIRNHSDRIAKVEDGVQNISQRVNKLEHGGS